MSLSTADPASIPSDPERLADEIARTAAHLDAATHRLLTCLPQAAAGSTHHRLVHEGGFGIAMGADGTLTFSDPRGRPISSAPKPPPLEGEPLDVLSTWNRQAGARLDQAVPYPEWDGAPVDYYEAVAAALRP